MSVRFTAGAGQPYTATLTGGAQANYTMAGWLNIQVDRNAASTFLGMESSGTDYAYIQTAADGTTMQLNDSFGVAVNTIALTVGTWYFFAISLAAGTGTMYARADSAAAFTTAAITGADTSVTLTTARIGDSQFSEPLNGSVAGVRMYSAALTAAELLLESYQLFPRRRTNLLAAWPLASPETADYSGNGKTLTGGTGVTADSGPGVPSIAPRDPRILASAVARSASW